MEGGERGGNNRSICRCVKSVIFRLYSGDRPRLLTHVPRTTTTVHDAQTALVAKYMSCARRNVDSRAVHEWDMQLLIDDGKPATRLFFPVRSRFCIAYDREEGDWDDLDDARRGREARLSPERRARDR